MKRSIASRLSALYTILLGVTVLVVILAASVALVYELSSYSRDILVAKHEQARFLADQYHTEGSSLKTAAPDMVRMLSGVGISVAVFDNKGTFLAGDTSLHPPLLSRMVAIGEHGPPRPPRNRFIYRGGFGLGPVPPPESASLTPVAGGFVAFNATPTLILFWLLPYWRVVIGIAIAAIAISYFVGRLFANHALSPINEVTTSLRALAGGDFTQRRFIAPGGDEIATLTEAYNDAAASISQAMEERRATDGRMRQFVADAGHELRTPLTVIGGYIDVLRRGAVNEPTIARQILGTMSIEREHMRTLIDRLMRLARLDSETLPHAESIDVAELLRGQCDAARRMDETREIDYSVDGADEIVADRTEIGEAIWNVVENALKYAPDAPIHLRAVRDNGHTTISVRDEGPGMTESERLHAFERFYRGDQRGEIVGSGLGLAIAKRAIERAGGSIAIDSAPRRGTTISITL
jgi:signal transduction histidine kinase